MPETESGKKNSGRTKLRKNKPEGKPGRINLKSEHERTESRKEELER